MMDHATDFDLFIGLILAKLYESRGTRPTLDPEDFGLLDANDPKWERWDTWANVFRWLKEEGYVRGKDAGQGRYGQPTFEDTELTERGFRLLNSVPPALIKKGSSQPLSKQLTDAARRLLDKSVQTGAEKGVDEVVRRVIEIVRDVFS
jgi:hypothetical protein